MTAHRALGAIGSLSSGSRDTRAATPGGAVTLLVLLACTELPLPVVGPPSPAVVAGPEIVTGPAHLAFAVALEIDRPATVDVLVEGGGEVRRLRTAEAGLSFEIPVVELAADTTYTVTVTLGEAVLAPLTHTTDALPEGFPNVDVRAHDPLRMEPGVTLFDVKRVDAVESWLVAIDDQLRVVWWIEGSVGDIRRLPSGNLFGLIGGRAVEIDVLGREIRSFGPPGRGAAVEVDVDAFHHELFPLEDGGFVTLAYGVRTAPSLPRDYADPWAEGPPALIRDGVVAVVAPDGTLVETFAAGGGLDTHHIGWDALDQVGTIDGKAVFDWAHANAVVPLSDGFLVSLRHQDAIVRLEADGGVRWVLSDPVGWDASMAPVLLAADGPLRWPMHQHAVALDPDGALVLFDNRNEGASPYAPTPDSVPFSRVVAYRVDEEARTVRELWAYEETASGRLYAPALGDADPQPLTGNVLSVWGFVSAEDEIPNADRGVGTRSVRLIEFDPRDGTEVLDVGLWLDREENLGGCTTYRAERVPTLSPPGVVRLPPSVGGTD